MKENAKKLKENFKKNNKFRIAAAALFLLVVFFICAGVFISQSADIKRLEAQYESYQQQLAEQEQENEELEAIIDSDDIDSYIEQKAREKGYVKSGEIVFYDISGSN
ncbi:MAG: septum formation initiator family protein [Clostridiales bacterium]|nr:septum formation initiator family protein [Clostridiales bacterium]